jgi:hypothetical protein
VDCSALQVDIRPAKPCQLASPQPRKHGGRVQDVRDLGVGVLHPDDLAGGVEEPRSFLLGKPRRVVFVIGIDPRHPNLGDPFEPAERNRLLEHREEQRSMVPHGEGCEMGACGDEAIRLLGGDLSEKKWSERRAKVRSQDGLVVFGAPLRGEHVRFPIRREIVKDMIFGRLGSKPMPNFIGRRLLRSQSPLGFIEIGVELRPPLAGMVVPADAPAVRPQLLGSCSSWHVLTFP